MKVLLFGNNRAAVEVARIVRRAGDKLVGLVVHPAAKRKYGRELIAAAAVGPGRMFQAQNLDRPSTLERIGRLAADVGVSASFGYILRKPILDLFPKGVLNLHPSYLPWNRGAYPNVWSIVDRTPAGATLHLLDEGVDTGPILAQMRVEVEPTDTGETLYRRLEEESLRLFADAWPKFKRGTLKPQHQDPRAGSVHKTKDVEEIDGIDQLREYKAMDLIDILRARTFPPYQGAFFATPDGRRVGIRITLTELDSPKTRRSRSKRI